MGIEIGWESGRTKGELRKGDRHGEKNERTSVSSFTPPKI